ncbi:MAG: hypothetical protein E7231_01565 [Cellulosilyticum sp.]|nr:hypothetical protein [Cellulosilyticum sp.]
MFEIIKGLIKGCETCDEHSAARQLSFPNAEATFFIMNVGPAYLGNKVIYGETGYHMLPGNMKFECIGYYVDGVLYGRDTDVLRRPEAGPCYSREGSDEEAEEYFNGKYKASLKSAYAQIESQVLNEVRNLLNKRPVPDDLTAVEGVKELGEQIAWDIAYLGESKRATEHIERFELSHEDFENIFLSLDSERTIKKVAEEFYFKWETELFQEKLATAYSMGLDFSNEPSVIMYKAIAATEAKTVNCRINGNGKWKWYKLNADGLMRCIRSNDYINWQFATQKEGDEACELFALEGRRGDIYTDQIDSITYGKKVIWGSTDI